MFVRRCYGRPGHGKLIRKARPLWVRSRDTVAIRAHLSALGCAPLNFLRRPNLKVSRLHVELLRLGRMMPVMFGLYSFLPTLAAETLEAKHVLILMTLSRLQTLEYQGGVAPLMLILMTWACSDGDRVRLLMLKRCQYSGVDTALLRAAVNTPHVATNMCCKD